MHGRCTKIKHSTRELAEKHLANLQLARHEPKRVRNRLCVYRCPICKPEAWHVGHSRALALAHRLAPGMPSKPRRGKHKRT